MDPKETERLITAAGGDSAFARLLGIADQPGYTQRVNNWKRRGIPPKVVLEHQLVLYSLRDKVRTAA